MQVYSANRFLFRFLLANMPSSFGSNTVLFHSSTTVRIFLYMHSVFGRSYLFYVICSCSKWTLNNEMEWNEMFVCLPVHTDKQQSSGDPFQFKRNNKKCFSWHRQHISRPYKHAADVVVVVVLHKKHLKHKKLNNSACEMDWNIY